LPVSHSSLSHFRFSVVFVSLSLSNFSLPWFYSLSLDLANLAADNLGVVLLELGPSLGLVIKGTIMLVGVAVQTTEQILASALEPCKANFFVAREASVLGLAR